MSFISTLCNIDSGVLPSMSNFKLFSRSATSFVENGQNISSIIWGHIMMPCKRIVCAPVVNILFLFSMMLFWQCAPTPQKVRFWYLLLMASTNPLSAKLPLLEWECMDFPDFAINFFVVDFSRSVFDKDKSCMRCTYTKSITWSTNVVQPHKHFLVRYPNIFGIKTGCADTILSTDMSSPGTLCSSVCIEPIFCSLMWRIDMPCKVGVCFGNQAVALAGIFCLLNKKWCVTEGGIIDDANSLTIIGGETG